MKDFIDRYAAPAGVLAVLAVVFLWGLLNL